MNDGNQPEFDGIRAVAVLAVVAYHVGVPGMAAGFVGVDVFFVISGYLITRQLVGMRDWPLGRTLGEFYARRARRILPALTLVTLATIALGWKFLLPAGEQQELGKSGVFAAIFTSNIFFWHRSQDYFAGPSELQPLLHTWSLGVEEQFYLFWPLLLGALWALQKRRPAPKSAGPVVYVVGSLTAASFSLWIWLATTNPAAAFYLAPSRTWELGVGALLALNLARPTAAALPESSKEGNLGRDKRATGITDLARLTEALGVLGFVLILIPNIFYQSTAITYEIAVVASVTGAGLLVTGIVFGPRGAVYRILATRPMQFTGQISYAWYLWHWPLIAFARVTDLGERSLVRDCALTIVAYGLAWISTRFLESPLRSGRIVAVVAPRRAIFGGLCLAVAAAAVSSGLWLSAQSEFRATLAPRSIDCLQIRDTASRPEVDPCLLAIGHRARLFLVGDSHANHWSPAVAAWAEANDVTAVERSISACPAPIPAYAKGAAFSGSLVSFPPGCVEFSQNIVDEVHATRSRGLPTGVVLTAHWETHVASTPATSGGTGIGSALGALLKSLEEAGVRVLVLYPTPEFTHDPPGCQARRKDSSCLLPRADHEAATGAALRMIESVLNRNPAVRYWDPTSLFCDTAYCSPVKAGHLMFRDYGHLSRDGAEAAVPALAPDLEWVAGID